MTFYNTLRNESKFYITGLNSSTLEGPQLVTPMRILYKYLKISEIIISHQLSDYQNTQNGIQSKLTITLFKSHLFHQKSSIFSS